MVVSTIGGIVGMRAIPAWAGYVTNLGIETTSVQDADVDRGLLGSAPVQDSLKS